MRNQLTIREVWVWVIPASLYRNRGFRSDYWGDDDPYREQYIRPGQLMDALNFRLGAGIFVVEGL